MSWNISYFLENIPIGFDSWNTSYRLNYYNETLYGFSFLDGGDQSKIADEFTSQNITDFWYDFADPVRLGYEAEGDLFDSTAFLDYIVKTYFRNATTTTTTTTEPTTTTEHPCDTMEQYDMDFTLIMAIPAAVIIVLVTLFKKRKQMCLDRCYGRPGIQYPINLVDEDHRRWAFMAAFAIIAYKVLNIFDGQTFWKPKEYDDSEFTKTWGWTSVLITLLNVIILGVTYYPLLMCVTLRKHIVMNLVGLAYFAPWMYLIAHIYSECSPMEKHDEGRGILQSLFDIPIFIAYLILFCAYVLDLVKNIIKLYRRWTAINQGKYMKEERRAEFFESKAIKYLEALFAREPKVPPETFLGRLKQKFVYERIEGFSFSLRILCTMTLAFLFLYKFHILLDYLGRFFYNVGKDIMVDIHPILEQAFTDLPVAVDYVEEALEVVYWSFFTCFLLSFILHVLFIFHMLLTYKRHMKKLLMGNIKWHFKNEISPAQQMVYGMRYSGYQIAYMFYGYAILGGVMWIGAILVSYLVVIPLRDGFFSPVIDQLKKLWPSIVFGLVILYSQILLAKFCFLQERGAYMALNNRRIYHITSFYLFFFNVVLGLFSCLRRILMSMVFGLILISRLDKCLLMRGFERFDAGYKAYLGMLEVEIYHSHPLLKAFILILQEQVIDTKARESGIGESTVASIKIEPGFDNGGMKELKFKPTKTYDKRIVIKWWKMVTLVHNPTLILERIEKKIRDKKANSKAAIVDGIIETTTTLGAGFVAATGLAVAHGLEEATDSIFTSL